MKKILIVEDDVQLMDILQTKLESIGFEIYRAGDVKSALDETVRVHPDLVILDIILPGTTGLDYLRDLKNNPQFRAIPVLVLTNMDNIINTALKAGATWCFSKVNTSINDVVNRIKEYLA